MLPGFISHCLTLEKGTQGKLTYFVIFMRGKFIRKQENGARIHNLKMLEEVDSFKMVFKPQLKRIWGGYTSKVKEM